jgi:hypothetical protein
MFFIVGGSRSPLSYLVEYTAVKKSKQFWDPAPRFLCLLKGLHRLYVHSLLFFLVLNGPMSNVVQLRTTPPLFKAYEEVYSNLESKYCPTFFKSEEVLLKIQNYWENIVILICILMNGITKYFQYFTYLLGSREIENTDGNDKNSGK